MAVKIRPGVWLVTGGHRVRVGEWPDTAWVPPGAHHARRAGDARTRCGLVAVEWPIFWEMGFFPSNPHACAGCAGLTERPTTDVPAEERAP